MKRNLLLFTAVLVGIILVVNSLRRLVSFRSTAQQIEDAKVRLQTVKEENESLKREFEYKKTDDFAEGEIRNKLGLAKEGETVVILPKDDSSNQQPATSNQVPGTNWEKWWDLFFGT